jgi:putative ABC transport system permease protein
VLVEAVAVGLIASLLGLAAGVGVAAGIKALLSGMGIDIPAGGVVLSNATIITSLVAGLGVSVVSAFFPARKGAKVPPIAAMRDVNVDDSGGSRRRMVSGIVVTGLGVAAMALGLFGGAGLALLGLGVPLVFIGVAVLGPVLARPFSRLLGWPLPRIKGTAGTLARENAMRNPKRTSTTAAALMIGVALVAFITILAASTKASISSTLDKSFTGDLVVNTSSVGSGGLSPELATQLTALPELDAVTGLRLAPALVNGSAATLTAADPIEMQAIVDFGVTEGSLADLGTGQIAVVETLAKEKGWHVGDTVQAQFAETGAQPLGIAAIYTAKDMAGEFFISLSTFDANMADHFDLQVLATVTDGVDIEQARAAVTAAADAYPQAEVLDRSEYKGAKEAKIDMMLNLVYAMLALAVFIALLGIANTLALSIFERTRELGLLRAVGMTRRQLRATVRYESVIIALFGTALGLIIGIGFGWSMITALSGEGLSTFAFPGGQLTVITVIAALAGVAAAVLPARRAAKLNVLEAIVSE